MSIKFGRIAHIRATRRFWLLLAGALVLGFGASCMLSLLRIHRLDRQLEALENRRRAQLEQLAQVQRRLQYAQTDAYVESIARDELNLIYPGEIRYIADEG